MGLFSAIKAKFFSKQTDQEPEPEILEASSETPKDGQKFGAFLGVFVPCILMLFGVIIFLRLGWIVGMVGLGESLIIITLASLITLITTFSMSAIATNIEVGKGGVYYMLSRSLGIEVGTAIGIPMYIRQALTIAFCCIGFAESLHDLVPSLSIMHISVGSLVALTFLAYTSVSGALKVQVFIFITILASLASLLTGSELSPMPAETFTPPVINNLGFWAVFAIFFPAMTGIESSVSLSGDLKNPQKSLPLGTISAISVAFLVYALIALFLVYRVPMDRLAQDPLVMQDLASVPALIIVGIWGATLSSALGGLLGAPRTLQAMAEDGTAPKIFAKTFGGVDEPRIATLVTFLIALIGACFGSVNIIAPLLTMVSLICYGVLNLSAGMETLIANPSWRPRFRVHWLVSLGGAASCLIVMLMIDAGSALACMSVVTIIYFFSRKRQHETSWADMRDGLLLFFARSAIYRLAYTDDTSKSWRPHFLVFTKPTSEHSTSLLKFAQGISQSKGFLTMASFVAPGTTTIVNRKELSTKLAKHFDQENVHALVQIREAEKVTKGMYGMIEHHGLGPLAPNTVVFGGVRKEDESSEFIKVLNLAYKRHNNIVIINGNCDLETSEHRDIHIWWDDENRFNSDLMVVLGYMLQLNPTRKRSRLCLKAIAENELKRKEKIDEFHEFSLKRRLPIDVDVYVSNDPAADQVDLIKEFSKEADMIFLGLKNIYPDISKASDYEEYLKKLSQDLEGLPLAFVLSSEFIPLETILE